MTAMTMTAAAGLMGVSRSQAHRLARQFADQGGVGLRHRARGRPSNRRLGPHVRELTIAYVTENYRDFGPTLASQMLLERHGLRVSRETLRNRSAFVATGAVVALLVLVVELDLLNRVFDTTDLNAGQWLASAAVGSTILLAGEAVKAVTRARRRRADVAAGTGVR